MVSQYNQITYSQQNNTLIVPDHDQILLSKLDRAIDKYLSCSDDYKSPIIQTFLKCLVYHDKVKIIENIMNSISFNCQREQFYEIIENILNDLDI
jgi:hypothetical protein